MVACSEGNQKTKFCKMLVNLLDCDVEFVKCTHVRGDMKNSRIMFNHVKHLKN